MGVIEARSRTTPFIVIGVASRGEGVRPGGLYDKLSDGLVDFLDVLFLESNYDPKLLSECNYPEKLKTRIKGGFGHLSNLQSAQMIRYHASTRLKHLILCHISDQANTMQIVNEIHRKVHQGDYKVSLAPRDDIGELVDLAVETLRV